jgi:hypothetical protein
MLDQTLGFATNTGSSSEGNNHFVLHHSISGSAFFTNPTLVTHMDLLHVILKKLLVHIIL